MLLDNLTGYSLIQFSVKFNFIPTLSVLLLSCFEAHILMYPEVIGKQNQMSQYFHFSHAKRMGKKLFSSLTQICSDDSRLTRRKSSTKICDFWFYGSKRQSSGRVSFFSFFFSKKICVLADMTILKVCSILPMHILKIKEIFEN